MDLFETINRVTPMLTDLEAQPAEELHTALRDSLVKGHGGERMWAAYMLGRFEDPVDIDLLLKRSRRT